MKYLSAVLIIQRDRCIVSIHRYCLVFFILPDNFLQLTSWLLKNLDEYEFLYLFNSHDALMVQMLQNTACFIMFSVNEIIKELDPIF